MRILFVQKRLLFPTDEGGKVRTLNVVRHLARWHQLTYLCNLKATEAPYVEQMKKLGVRLVTVPWRETPRESFGFYRGLASNLLSACPYTVAKDYDARLRRRAAELLADETYDLLICDFVQMAQNVMGLPGPAALLFTHNVEAEIYRRHVDSDSGWARRKYMALQWHKMRRFEAQAGRQFDAVVAVSLRDKRTFEREYGWKHVHAIDTAVDTDYCRPSGAAEDADRLVMVGSLDWLPNVDGAGFFVREVWPRIRAANPRANFLIVGRNPDSAVRRLEKTDGVRIAANVPDVRPYLSQAAVVVVPLLVGGGTRLKIFEAMAMGKAVVSTSLGAEGLNVIPGVHIELADHPESFADKVLRLLADPDRRRRIGKDARSLVTKHYSAETVARQFERICRQTRAIDGPKKPANPPGEQASRPSFRSDSSTARLVDVKHVQLTPRQQREREYYEERSRRKRPSRVDFAPVLGDERRPWNSYWYVAELVKDLFSSPSQKLLDFGCGPGTAAVRYAYLGYQVYGFDVSPNNIRIAQELAEQYGLADRTDFSVQVAEDLSYPDETFDVVVGTDILHHCEIEPALRQCVRVLKRGGVAIFREHVEVPVLDSIRKSRLLLRLFPREKSFDAHITEDERNLTAEDLRIVRRGFFSVSMRRFGLFGRLRRIAKRFGRGLHKADYYLFKILPVMSTFGGEAVMTLKRGAEPAFGESGPSRK